MRLSQRLKYVLKPASGRAVAAFSMIERWLVRHGSSCVTRVCTLMASQKQPSSLATYHNARGSTTGHTGDSDTTKNSDPPGTSGCGGHTTPGSPWTLISTSVLHSSCDTNNACSPVDSTNPVVHISSFGSPGLLLPGLLLPGLLLPPLLSPGSR